MPRAEAGSLKHLNNKMKSKGLQRLRWYCQVCERQMRDENGFKCHTQSESHLRQILIVGEDPKKAINDFSEQFKKDFLTLLRSSHGEKKIHANHFYQEYIHNKDHVHMNSTKWTSLSEFTKMLGREGVCRVEENEKGLFIAYVDRSPEALARQEAIRKKERQDKGDEEREQRLIREQIARAEADKQQQDVDQEAKDKVLVRDEGEKIKLSFGTKKITTPPPPALAALVVDQSVELASDATSTTLGKETTDEALAQNTQSLPAPPMTTVTTTTSIAPVKMSMKLAPKKPGNVFAMANKKLSGEKKPVTASEPKRPMSEAERIMKQELERKRNFSSQGGSSTNFKRQRV